MRDRGRERGKARLGVAIFSIFFFRILESLGGGGKERGGGEAKGREGPYAILLESHHLTKGRGGGYVFQGRGRGWQGLSPPSYLFRMFLGDFLDEFRTFPPPLRTKQRGGVVLMKGLTIRIFKRGGGI